MSDVVIDVKSLGKSYVIRHRNTEGDGLRHAAEFAIRHPVAWFRSRREQARRGSEEFWALKDVTFAVREGEALGVIGRNGAGKSTLLKVLSRITEPTTGEIRYRGSVSSLLEVGTGFHPELTGRENIFLNAAILGMKRSEIARRFDEIVAFAEVEKFLDTPVKRYSSGMYVRLAFAVAAHLRSTILLVDEVLAVGDAAFQMKCLGKMSNVVQGGRTVLFVSHNMGAITSLCTRAILLEGGCLSLSGSPRLVIEEYLSRSHADAQVSLASRKDREGRGRMRFTNVSILNERHEVVQSVLSGQDICLVFDYDILGSETLSNVNVQLRMCGTLGQPLFACRSRVSRHEPLTLVPGGRLYCSIPRLPLMPGVYTFTVGCVVNETLEDLVPDAGKLSVVEGDYFGTGKLPPSNAGDFLVAHTWSVG